MNRQSNYQQQGYQQGRRPPGKKQAPPQQQRQRIEYPMPPDGLDVKSVIKWHREHGANVLTPQSHFDDKNGLFSPVAEVVWLSPNHHDKDVYPSDKKFRLHSSALEKLAGAACIQWNPKEYGPLSIISGKKCTFKVSGGLMTPDGTTAYTSAIYEHDIENYLDDLNAKWKSQDDKWKVDRDYRHHRKFMVEISESMARARLIRKVLGPKGEYTFEELCRPFIVVRWQWEIDMSDHETKRMVTMAMVGARFGIYGPGSGNQQSALGMPSQPALLPHEKQIIDAEVAERNAEGPVQMPQSAGRPPAGPPPMDEPPPYDDLPPQSEYPATVEEFLRLPVDRKPSEIARLAEFKGFDLNAMIKKPLTEWQPGHMDQFYRKLEAMEA